MLKKYLAFNLAFALLFVLQLATESGTFTTLFSIQQLHYFTKPLITISLFALLVYHTNLRGRFSRRIAFGLFFGLLGDVSLMFQDQDALFFIFGLISFLIGHFLYIAAFNLDFLTRKTDRKHYTLWAFVFFSTFCIIFYFVLKPFLGEMEIPVLVYAIVISAMAVTAVNRYGRINSLSFNLVLAGAILFVISDSFLAINKFAYSFPLAGIAVMSTYMLAQYLITVGSIERKFKKKVKG